jgi:hypothetical protein
VTACSVMAGLVPGHSRLDSTRISRLGSPAQGRASRCSPRPRRRRQFASRPPRAGGTQTSGVCLRFPGSRADARAPE